MIFLFILLIILAVIIIAALFAFNMKADVVEKNRDQESVQEPIREAAAAPPPVENANHLMQEKMEEDRHADQENLGLNSEEMKHSSTNLISDNAYRKALQSFKHSDQKDAAQKPKEKMNDDVFRKALQNMSQKDEK